MSFLLGEQDCWRSSAPPHDEEPVFACEKEWPPASDVKGSNLEVKNRSFFFPDRNEEEMIMPSAPHFDHDAMTKSPPQTTTRTSTTRRSGKKRSTTLLPKQRVVLHQSNLNTRMKTWSS